LSYFRIKPQNWSCIWEEGLILELPLSCGKKIIGGVDRLN
jgi:hypothetical protein